FFVSASSDKSRWQEGDWTPKQAVLTLTRNRVFRVRMEHDANFRAGVTRAAEIMGGQKALAKACGLKGGSIWATINTKKKMPAWLAVRIVDATGGQVSIKDLLPDVYERVEAEISE